MDGGGWRAAAAASWYVGALTGRRLISTQVATAPDDKGGLIGLAGTAAVTGRLVRTPRHDDLLHKNTPNVMPLTPSFKSSDVPTEVGLLP